MNNQSVFNSHTEAQVVNAGEPVETIHMPSPSWAPIIMALGMTGVCFGIVLSAVVLVVGVVLLMAGLGMWIFDEIQHASEEDAEEQQAEGAS